MTMTSSPAALPLDGFSRWRQIEQVLPLSRETFRKMVLAGAAPPAVKMGLRCTMYSNIELHKFLQDPINYRAGGAK